MSVCRYAAHVVFVSLLPPINKGTARGGFESTDVVTCWVYRTSWVVLAVLAVGIGGIDGVIQC